MTNDMALQESTTSIKDPPRKVKTQQKRLCPWHMPPPSFTPIRTYAIPQERPNATFALSQYVRRSGWIDVLTPTQPMYAWNQASGWPLVAAWAGSHWVA